MISNKKSFPNVDFVPENKIRPIGTIGGVRLVLLGKEQGTDALVVSHSYSEPFDTSEEFFAVPIYELLSHTQDPIDLSENI